MTSHFDDHYKLLGVPQNATPKELRQAYLQLLVTAHPDKGGDPEQFAAIQRAYGVLSNQDERLIYDEQLERRRGATATSSSSQAAFRSSIGGNIQTHGVVTVVIHGQTQTTPQRPHIPADIAAAGQPAGDASSSELRDISDRIRGAMQECSRSGGDQSSLRNLAELHLQRAEVHVAAGRLHHAAFDAQEAARICPACTDQATELQQRLKAPSKDREMNE